MALGVLIGTLFGSTMALAKSKDYVVQDISAIAMVASGAGLIGALIEFLI